MSDTVSHVFNIIMMFFRLFDLFFNVFSFLFFVFITAGSLSGNTFTCFVRKQTLCVN